MVSQRKPRAVAYLRVSSPTQVAEDRYGLADQERDVRHCAKAAGLRLVGILRDEGVSGTKTADERRGLADALSMISDGAAEVLVVPRLDRLARELTIQEAALAHVWKHGGRVFACDQVGEVPRDDPDDPMRTAMRQMVGVFSQLDRGMIVARLRRGRRLAAESGRRIDGRSPYGYTAVKGQLVKVPEEQKAVALARKLRRRGGRGSSYRAIAKRLNEEGFETKGGRPWQPMVIKRIVERAA